MFVGAPTPDKVSPVDVRDECANEIRRDVIASVCSFVPEQLFTNKYSSITFDSDQVWAYNRATYFHRYDFSANVDIMTPDTFIPPSIALNKIETDYVDEDNEEQVDATDTVEFEI